MKAMRWWVGFAAATLLVATMFGCGGGGKKVDTAPLEKSFASGDAGAKGSAQKAVDSIKAGRYQEAMAELQKLASDVKLTPEQRQAVKDVVEQVKQAIGETLNKAAKDGTKALGDVQKSLGK